jgi:uncharacterized repeat protein (TIGR02543 family)
VGEGNEWFNGNEAARGTQFTITFDSRDGSEVSPIRADEGALVDKPADPDREGYTFLGWYTGPEGGELFTAWPHTLAGDLSLYARWYNKTESPIELYTIIFDSAGGTDVSDIEAFAGSLIGKPGDPEKEGYTFLGWYTAAAGGEAYAWPLELTGDLNLYAQWLLINRYTLSFDSAGGTEVPPLTADEGAAFDKPEDPAYDGYTFLGWFTEPEGGELFTAWPYTLAGDLTLYAQWHENTADPVLEYTITFNIGGGTELSELKVYEGTPVGKPVDPVKEGYAFLGWFDAAEGGTEYEWPHTAASDVTLYAQWLLINRYTLSFDSAGGTELPPLGAYEGTPLDKPKNPVKVGYTFQGWFTEPEAGELFTAWPHILIGDLTIYAQWTANKYTIAFNNRRLGSAVETLTRDYGTEIEKPADPPAFAGYIFQGWESGGELYVWPHTLTGNLTLYARWTGINYTVEYDGNGGTGSTAPTSHVYGLVSPLAENGFTREGYEFAGWNTRSDRYGVTYPPGSPAANLTKENGGTVTLYARWTDTTEPVYTISFDSRGGSEVGDILVNVEGSTGQPLESTRSGYTFKGWFDAAEGGELYSWPFEPVGDITIYAQWTPFIYAITYNLNGGSNPPGSPQSYTIESVDITMADPVRAGYDFGGWYGNTAFTGSAVNSIAAGSVGDKTFYAKWTPVSYTISYNLDGGSGAAGNPVAYTIESETISLAAPVRTNYDFAGWFGNEKLTGSAVNSIAADSVGDKTFYAKWTPVSYTITYNLDGENAAENPASYTVESEAITLAAPSRTGYSFLGWYDNANLSGSVFNSIPAGSTGNKTFWAKWTSAYNVTYNANGGNGSVASSVHIMGESNILASNGFTRPEYVFAGWNTKPDGGGAAYKAGMSVPNLTIVQGREVTLYARWLPQEQTIELADPPTRGWGHNAAGALLWQFFPERKEFVIFAGQDYKSKTDSTVYVTGRTTVNRIRVVPGKSENNWANGPNYSDSGAYKYSKWGSVEAWHIIYGISYVPHYPNGAKIPAPKLIGQIYDAHQIRIIFVNAEIDIPNRSYQSPLDIGPYHASWLDSSFEGDFYRSIGRDYLNDHEIDAVVEFEGKNKLYSPTWQGITVWDSSGAGWVYVNNVPWQPDSNSYDSWKTQHNFPHWQLFAWKCIQLMEHWGWWGDNLERFNSYGWGPSSLNMKFRDGGSLIASDGDDPYTVQELSGGDITLSASGDAWGLRVRPAPPNPVEYQRHNYVPDFYQEK